MADAVFAIVFLFIAFLVCTGEAVGPGVFLHHRSLFKCSVENVFVSHYVSSLVCEVWISGPHGDPETQIHPLSHAK